MVNFGTVKLDAADVKITSQTSERVVYNYKSVINNPKNPKEAGVWKGTYTRIYDDEAESMNIFGMLSDGSWERYRVTSHGPKWSWIGTFRAFFKAADDLGNKTFKTMYTYTGNDDDETDDIEEFPSGEFENEFFTRFKHFPLPPQQLGRETDLGQRVTTLYK